MGKARNKDGSEVQYLRGIINNLRSENRNLKKRLKQLEKKEHYFDNKEYYDEPVEEIKQLDLCESCGKGDYKIIDLGRVKYKVCPLCDNRKKI